MTDSLPQSLRDTSILPASGMEAILRGARGHCPRCDAPGLFTRFLKPVGHCPACGQDWSLQRADDFPAYIAILIAGHLLAPVIVGLLGATDLGPGALAAIVIPLAILFLMLLIQPAKGGVIALQWWLGMHGFVRERRPGVEVK